MHLESTRFSPSPESQTFSKHTLVRKSRTSAKIFTCHGQVIPSFFKSRKRHDKPPRFGGAVSVFVCAVRVLVCAVRVLVCAVRVFVCAVSILFVLWAIWFWCEVFVIVAINFVIAVTVVGHRKVLTIFHSIFRLLESNTCNQNVLTKLFS